MLSDSAKLDLILKNLAGVNARLDRVDQRMDGLEQRISSFETGVNVRFGRVER